jgi:hypothetical protein
VLALFVFACAFAAAEFAVRLLYKNKTVLFPRYHTTIATAITPFAASAER